MKSDLEVMHKSKRRWLEFEALVCGVLLALWLVSTIRSSEAQPVADERMERACKLPRNNGELTVFIVEDNKMKCWVMQ